MPDQDRITFSDRLRHAWNAFSNQDRGQNYYNIGPSSSYRPDRLRINSGTERSIVQAVYTRIAIDVASINLFHVRLDQNGSYIETIQSGLNNCLTIEANIDQAGRTFMRDVVLSLFDEGVIAIVPVDTSINPSISGSFDIQTMRTGRIVEWYPLHVKVNIYNEKTGLREDIVLPKRSVAIVENPLYSVMNEPNSTLKRLIYKLNLLDAIDTQSGSGKLDLIIQLPYVIKTEKRRQDAETRRKDIEDQLKGSQYGIAYTDGTEKITQLNRPAENRLMGQIEYLTKMLYSQLGLTEDVFNGTADERVLLNYFSRTVEPILSEISDAMSRNFITKTGRSQGQTIKAFRDPFSLVPVSELATIADTFTRNEILTGNEFRSIVGYRPSDDPAANELRNKNLNKVEPPPVPDQQPNIE